MRLMNALGRTAHHSILSAMPSELGARAAIAEGIRAEFPIEGRAPALHGKPSPVRYLALARYMQNFDLVLTYNWGSMDAVMAHRLLSRVMPLPPLIHHEDGFNADEADGLNWKRSAFRRAALPTARAVVVPSHVLERTVRSAWGKTLPVVRISNGIPVARYARPVAGSIPGLDTRAGEVIVGTIAGLRAVKGLDLLVEALALTPPQIRLVIVGEGPEREAIASTARRLGVADRVLMPGFLSDPYRYAGLFDVMALSSLSEQQPIAVMEAMAAAVPVVAPPVGDVREMLSPENRPFIVERDAAELAGAMATLAADKPLRQRIGKANRAKALAEFDESRMIAAYEALYSQTIDEPLQARQV